MDSSKSNRSYPKKRKGQKATRGKPLFFDEKKERVQVMLTPKAIKILDNFAKIRSESRSQWLELHLRAIGNQDQS